VQRLRRTPEEWDYGPGNGNFVPQNVNYSRTALCVRTTKPAGLCGLVSAGSFLRARARRGSRGQRMEKNAA
jgi:hypothetical protein